MSTGGDSAAEDVKRTGLSEPCLAVEERRVLVLAPTGHDATLTNQFLTRSGFEVRVCPSVVELAAEVTKGCGTVLLAEEVLGSDSVAVLVEALSRQPSWSDVPVIIITSGGEVNQNRLRRLTVFGPGVNVFFLERPFRPGTLTSTVEGALRARQRQYQVRGLVQALQDGERQLRLVTDHAPTYIVQCGRDHRFKFVNRTYAVRYGLDAESILGKHVSEIVGARAYDSFKHHIDSVLSGQRVEFEMEIPYATLGPRWVYVVYVPEYSPQGEVTGLVGVITDITERKRVEQELAAHARRSALVSETAAQLLMADTPRALLVDIFRKLAQEIGAEMYFNHLAVPDGSRMELQSFGGLTPQQRWELAELGIGQAPAGLTGPPRQPVVLADLQSGTGTEHAWLRGWRIRAYVCHPLLAGERLLGTFALASTSRDKFGEEDLRCVVTVGDLIAVSLERSRLLQEVREARDAAERANQTKDNFLATLSHELRTPLNPVLLLASESANAPGLPPEVRKDFETIVRNVTLEARLIDDLLDLTRITRGKLAVKLCPVDVHAVLQDVLAIVRPEITEKRLNLKCRFHSGPAVILGDVVRLQQIFWNVLKNAVKFTPAEGTVGVDTAVARVGNRLSVIVTDSGIGLTPTEEERIFSAFAHGGSHRFGGMGLGLAISRMLVELHSGTIRAHSSGRDQGATFVIDLPLAPLTVEPAPADAAEPPAVPAPKSTAPVRILLVEDHETTREALTQLLKRRNYEVASAGSVAEAQRLAEQGKFDLLISDLGLPDGNGCELMARLRESQGLRGIALSGYGMEEDISHSRRAGFVAHLTKPVSVQALEAALATGLNHSP